ncbi:MAG: hypothetical protein H0U49_00910 [Parachlamydiaceae bacterium]|nr:hypothetical protein [Parachlamydiaceae bacterium]
MRAILKEEFPEKSKFQNIYDQQVVPLVKHAKESSYSFTAQACAARGRAAQAGLGALKKRTKNQSLIKAMGTSSQEVFLLPEEKAVFKRSHARAAEEERIINDLFDLMSPQAVVGTFKFKTASRRPFSIKISENTEKRGYSIEALEPTLRQSIKKRLSPEDVLLLNWHETTPSGQKKFGFYDYQNFLKSKSFTIQQPGGNWQYIKFIQLQQLHLQGKLHPDARVGSSLSTATSVSQHFLNGDLLSQALNYNPSSQKEPSRLYLTPDLTNPEDKRAYKICEQFKWSFKDDRGRTYNGSFKDMHKHYLNNIQMFDVQCIPNKSGEKLPTNQDLQKALNVRWKAVCNELMSMQNGVLLPLSDFEAKPFISNMVLIKDINQNLREAILQRLTPNAEFNAILTGEVQLLDLHDHNLGLAPHPTAEYEKFKDFKFLIGGAKPETYNFTKLIMDYLDGKILATTPITFVDGGKTISKNLNDLPELQKALDVQWQLVIFDTDLSLTENNYLQVQIRKGITGHLIPLRSVLLETDWKNRPLNKETVQRLMESTERDLRVEQWIKKSDTAIYKQLSPQVRELVKRTVKQDLETYNLSDPRKKHRNTTIKNLQDQFVQNMVNIDPISPLYIWKAIEGDLSQVVIRSNDTWQTIAKRHNQDVITIQLQNQKELKIGEKVKIHYDLTSSSSEAIRKRENIAAQLFPHITYSQQDALLERQQHRKEYLISYNELTESKLAGKALLDQIKQFIQKLETPLSSIRKESLLKDLNDNGHHYVNNPRKMVGLKAGLCEECQPTYFNLMKAMYPLLADAYALNKAVYGNDIYAGQKIGLYTEPLEKVIDEAKRKYDPNSPEGHLFLNLENQISSIRKPAFFGNWA